MAWCHECNCPEMDCGGYHEMKRELQAAEETRQREESIAQAGQDMVSLGSLNRQR